MNRLFSLVGSIQLVVKNTCHVQYILSYIVTIHHLYLFLSSICMHV